MTEAWEAKTSKLGNSRTMMVRSEQHSKHATATSHPHSVLQQISRDSGSVLGLLFRASVLGLRFRASVLGLRFRASVLGLRIRVSILGLRIRV